MSGTSTKAPSHVLAFASGLSKALGLSGLQLAEVYESNTERMYTLKVSEQDAKKFLVRFGGAVPTLEFDLYEKSGTLSSVAIRLSSGGDILGSKVVELRSTDQLRLVVEEVMEMCNPNKLRALDEAVEVLKQSGFEVLDIEYYNRDYIVSATKQDRLKVRIYIGLDGQWSSESASIVISAIVDIAEQGVRYITKRDIRHAISMHELSHRIALDDVLVDNVKNVVIVHVAVDGNVHTLLTAIDKLDELVKELAHQKVALVKLLPPSDAMALYLVGAVSGDEFYWLLSETSMVSENMVLERAKEYAVATVGETSSLDELIEKLYKAGKLTVDEDGYVVLDGRRVIDVVARYTGYRFTYPVVDDEEGEEEDENPIYDVHIAEDYLLTKILRICSANLRQLVEKWSVVPDRVVREAKHAFADNPNIYLEIFAGNQDVWSKLSPRSKLLLLKSFPSLIDIARERGWSWIFTDVFMVACTRTAGKPAYEVTRVIAEEFPDLVGGDFDVLYAGGEPFIKVGNAVLQVRRVLAGSVEVHGTIGTSGVGMVARGRTVVEAAKAILWNLVDAFHEFRELVSELRSNGYSVVLNKYKTPLFSIPYISLAIGGQRVVVPLHAGIRSNVKKVLENFQARSRELLEELA